MDAVRLELSGDTAVVASSFIIRQGVCIASVGDAFSVLSLSACFGGMIVHFAVCAFALLASVSLSTSESATYYNTATAMISAREVLGRSGGYISDFLREGRSLGIFAAHFNTLLGHESWDSLFKDLDSCFL